MKFKYLNLHKYYIKTNFELVDLYFVDKLHLSLFGYALWSEKLIRFIDDNYS
jgi:hypothetical protein